MTTAQSERVEELRRRVDDFHGVDLTEVLDVIDYLRDNEDSVLVGGSLAYGLGNRESDLDIVIAGPATAESSSRMPLEHFIKSLRVDVWRLHRNEIDALFEQARKGLASDTPMKGAFGNVLEQADLKLLHRVAYGLVIDGQPLVPSRIADYHEIARDVIVREYAERMRHALYVAQLGLVAERPRVATMNARFGVEDALQVVIAARGLPFSDNKWLQVRLEQDMPDLGEIYLPFATLPDTPEQALVFVRNAVMVAEELTGLRLGADVLSSEAAWEPCGLRLHKAGELRVLLSVEQDVIFRLEVEEAEAWKSLESERTFWPCGPCTDSQSRLCFALYAEGMIKLAWLHGIHLSDIEPGK